jgi:hypothetical protein
VGRSAGHADSDRKTMAVCNCHDLAPFSALRLTNSRAPFFAPAKEPSMKASLISTLPRSRKSATRARNTSTKVPSCCHC